jgi:predicted nucleic acid-binding protein
MYSLLATFYYNIMAQQKPKLIYWKPGQAVRASQVYLDANFIVALARTAHIWQTNASALMAHFKERGTTLSLSSLALNEATYQLIRLAEKDETPSDSNLALRLDDVLLSLPILRPFEPAEPSFHRLTLKAIAELGLDPTDAFHYTAARRLGCPLVSNDAGFQKIPDEHLTLVTFF